jgi:predicted enzyme related to lactoylglutathione lyase
MDGKVVSVPLVVRNTTKSLEFFTEKVGFEKKTDVTGPNGYRYVTVGPKGQEMELAFWEVGSLTDPDQRAASAHWAPATTPPINLSVSDCRKTHQELSGRGVEFPQPPSDHPWGVVATFRDLDGNLFSISQRKGWPAPK